MATRSRTSRCTKASRRRGTAEIELLLTVMLLVVILLLTTSTIRLALARLDTAQSARVEASRRAAGAQPDSDDVSVTPLEGYTTIRPGLPLRAHAPRFSQDVPVFQDRTSSSSSSAPRTITISATALSISPSWPYPAECLDGSSDYGANQQWFLDYFNDTHGPACAPLQLAPAWPP